jgi:hypothetical protein
MPSSTGKPGGKRTGDHVLDYPIPGGRFEALVKKLSQEGFEVPWCDRQPAAHVATETLQNALDRVQGLDTPTRPDQDTGTNIAPWSTNMAPLPPDLDIAGNTPTTKNRSNRLN